MGVSRKHLESCCHGCMRGVYRYSISMRIHTPTFPCERDWCRSMKARAVGADEHLAGDLYYIHMDERNGCRRALRGSGGGGGGGGGVLGVSVMFQM